MELGHNIIIFSDRKWVFKTPGKKTGNSYSVGGKRYYPLTSAAGFAQRGLASWYGRKFHGRLTSNGERYNMYGRTAAHKTLPFNTYVRVTNLKNRKNAAKILAGSCR